MIQHKKYGAAKYKKSSYEEIREIVMEKEKGNNPVEDKIKINKTKIFNSNSNHKIMRSYSICKTKIDYV